VVDVSKIEDQKRTIDDRIDLGKAVNTFSDQMYKRLIQKLEEGYHGWDSDSAEVIGNVLSKLEKSVDNLFNGEFDQCVDIANLVMMLDRHTKHSLKDGLDDLKTRDG